jgi:sulfur relay (sulfurtransferase) DsrC/TusE family protein
MSTFQLSRNAVEWSRSFSEKERATLDFTCEDILPVAGTHRKLLQYALANCKPKRTNTDIITDCDAGEETCNENSTIEMQAQLHALTATKEKVLVQLKLLDAQISDWEDHKIEEGLRADQYNSILDEQSKIVQFIRSFISESTFYGVSPPLTATLHKMTEQATAASDIMTTSGHEERVPDTSRSRPKDLLTGRAKVATDQDLVIDSYFSLLSSMEKTRSAGPDAEISHDHWTTTQLMERVNLQAAEKESLLACIRKEEVKIHSNPNSQHEFRTHLLIM